MMIATIMKYRKSAAYAFGTLLVIWSVCSILALGIEYDFISLEVGTKFAATIQIVVIMLACYLSGISEDKGRLTFALLTALAAMVFLCICNIILFSNDIEDLGYRTLIVPVIGVLSGLLSGSTKHLLCKRRRARYRA